MNLAVHDHWIHHASQIVNRSHLHDFRRTGFGINFDFSNIATIRESIGRLDFFAAMNATLRLSRREFSKSYKAVSTNDRYLALLNHQIFGFRLKKMGGEVMSPLDAGVVKFRAPDGTIAELVQKDRYENLKKHHGVA